MITIQVPYDGAAAVLSIAAGLFVVVGVAVLNAILSRGRRGGPWPDPAPRASDEGAGPGARED